MIPDDKSNLRKIERELYTTDIQPPNKRGFLHDTKIETRDSWRAPADEASAKSSSMNPRVPTNSIFKKIFIGSIGFLLLAIVIFAISFLSGSNSISAQNVELEITSASFVDGGENLPLQVSIINKNNVQLELATLVLEYPGATSNATAVTRINRDIGTVGVGDAHLESFNLQLYGPENSQKVITAHIEFRVAGSNAVYDKDQTASITIRTSPLTLTLDAPENAVANQEIPLTFTIMGNGTTTLSNTALVLQYPPEFSFKRASPSASFGNNVWYLGDVPPGANRNITVYGSFGGAVNNLNSISASVGLQSQRDEQTLDTIYNSLTQVIPLTNAFLSAQIEANGESNPTTAISGSQTVRVTIPWQNTLASQIKNAEIRVRLSGSAYDPGKVQVGNGYFDSANNMIIWTSQQDSKLGTIAPGDSGEESFSFTPRQLGNNTSVANPSVAVSVDIQGLQVGGGRLTVANVDQKTFVINSDLSLLARTIHYSGQISNTGPMPPVANQETTYALEWQVTNFRNAVSNVVVSTTLPAYVSWKDVIVPQSEKDNVTYNEVSRSLSWDVGSVPAGTGSSSPARTLSMKVGVTPSTTDRGSVPKLTDIITITGHDTFTNQDINFTRREMTTQLLNDTGGAGTDGVVR